MASGFDLGHQYLSLFDHYLTFYSWSVVAVVFLSVGVVKGLFRCTIWVQGVVIGF